MQGSSVDPSDDWAIGHHRQAAWSGWTTDEGRLTFDHTQDHPHPNPYTGFFANLEDPTTPEHPTSTERTQEVIQTGVQDWMSDEEKAAVGAAGRERIASAVDRAIGDVERPRYHWQTCPSGDPQGCYGCSLHGGHCGHCPMARPTTDPGLPTIGVQRGGPQWTWNTQWHRNHYAQGDGIIQEERATTEDLRAAHYPGPTSHPGTGTFLNDNEFSVINAVTGINQATGHTYATHTQLVEALADADRRLMDATERFDKRLRKMEKRLRKAARRG